MKRPATRGAKRLAADSAQDAVRAALEDYAKRGVFSGFGQTDTPRGKTVFSFVWLHDRPMELSLDPAKSELRFDRILPGVKAGTPLALDLKRLIEKLTSDEVPQYRRVDPQRAALACSN